MLLVGETPTAGIHKEQFFRAIDIICSSSGEGKCTSASRIDIIGPTFSGSLYSLSVLEHQIASQPSFRIRSGTVMSSAAISRFTSGPLKQDFLTLKDTDGYLIDRFVEFVKTDGIEGYKEKDIALISEDETAFGGLSSAGGSEPTQAVDCTQAEPTPHAMVAAHPCLLRLYFPRGIALLRTAYQNDPVLSSGTENSTGPHSRLKLNLDSTGSDDDSVPTYAGSQTALSQEAVMMGIVTVLRVYDPHFVILRATDPKDLLFLTRFFRMNYPQDRIITMGADQLYPRDVNDTIFRGVLSLTNYPLLPKQLTDFNPPRPHRVFANTEKRRFVQRHACCFDRYKSGG